MSRCLKKYYPIFSNQKTFCFMATKKEKEAAEKQITVSLNLKTIKVPIVGVSPLIVNRFDEKSRRQIEEIGKAETKLKQGGKKKNISDPEEDYHKSIYYCADGKTPGFPAGAFKAAIVTCAYRTYGRAQTVTRSAFHVLADDIDTGLVKINGEHRMREDMVRVGGMQKVASPRYRAEFPSWSAVLTISYLADVITEKEIVGLVNAAGFTCGVGEWRPEKSSSGSFGMFTVASE